MTATRSLRVSLLTVAILVLSAVYAFGSFTADTRATTMLGTLTVASVGAPAAATLDGCAEITVSWQRAANADSYAVERQVGTAAWQLLDVDAGDVLDLVDASPPLGDAVRYRITPRHRASGWTGPSAVTPDLPC